MNSLITIIITLVFVNLSNGQSIRGLIESCSGWSLNKLPKLKAFLLEPNGVDLFKNVQVNFIPGRKAVLTIYKEGGEEEKITLSDYDDTDRLHTLFLEKGFEKYTEVEIDENRKLEMPKHFAHLDGVKSNEVNSARENFKLAKEKMKRLRAARDNFMMDAQYITP